MCQQEGCQTRPVFNYADQTNALYCAQHKKENMVNVKSKMCQQEGCQTIPNFNYADQTNGLYCAQHKKENMVDVKHKTCQQEGCQTQPHFNYAGQTNGLYCAQHKKENMVDVKNKTCQQEGCQTLASNKRYEGYCLPCYMNNFPDKPVVRNYKTKEYAVVNYIKQEFEKFSWIYNKRIYDGCSKRSPDLLLDLGYQIIIIEIDENQHKNYDCSCENKRLMEISNDLNNRNIIFIRFNPDNYYISKNKKITSCWGIDGNGICVVKKSKRKEWEERLIVLKNTISYWLEPGNKTNKLIETVELFYDREY